MIVGHTARRNPSLRGLTVCVCRIARRTASLNFDIGQALLPAQ
ncbi:MAG: hypothetical protein N2Z69_08110 [Methylophilaceae bacterium]|nr:hypothetical protein [Methylophilaceae bacterium]